MLKAATVLIISGHDPSGGAGLVADVNTVAALGAHPLSVPSCWTAQNSGHWQEIWPLPASQWSTMAQLLREDCDIAAVKIGLLPDQEVAHAVLDFLASVDVPVVLDPILFHGSSGRRITADTLPLLRRFAAKVTVLTPNEPELSLLSPGLKEEDAAMQILAGGEGYLLLTGGHSPGPQLHNYLYDKQGQIACFRWPRLPFSYRGTGCLLSTALAVFLAQGADVREAVEKAQQYCWSALQKAYPCGRSGQYMARRSALL